METNRYRTSKEDNKLFFLCVLFVFTMLFPPLFFHVDLRIPIGLFWVFLSRKALIDKRLMLAITLLAIYAFSVYLVSTLLGNDTSLALTIRYYRAALSVVVIYSFFSGINSSQKKIVFLKAILFVLLLHACIIFLEVFFPDIKRMLYFWAKDTALNYPFRANGFVNGFEFAGMYTIFGMLMSLLFYCYRPQFRYVLFFLVFVVSTFFTSRSNMVLAIVVLLCFRLFCKSHLKNRFFLRIFLTLIIVATLIGALLIWALTTNLFVEFREFVFSRFSWGDRLYTFIKYNGYGDQDFLAILKSQYTDDSGNSFFSFLGLAMDPNRDPGYVQIIYSIGIVGAIAVVSIYFMMLFSINKKRSFIENLVFVFFCYLFVYQLIVNFKILMLFATGAFELLLMLYYLLPKKTANSHSVLKAIDERRVV